MTITCNTGSVIHIISSTYGRLNEKTCPSEISTPSSVPYMGCQEKDGLSVIQQNCEGKQSCSIVVKPDIFGLDGYPSCNHVLDKYLKVVYGCTTGR